MPSLVEPESRVIPPLVLEVDLRAAWSNFAECMNEDWLEGKYEDLHESLRSARQKLKSEGSL